MPKSPANDLSNFLRRQTADALADVLLELAESSEQARRRLERWQLADRPDKLAATFRTQLAGWKRARRFLDHSEARAFSQDLRAWLEQVADELLPRDPGAALDLLEAFIQTDSAWFERADDSDGHIADVVRQACGLWLEAAARCESPAAQWPARLITLYDSDGYGGREPLLRHADRLLDEPGLRQLVAVYEQRLEQVLSRPSDGMAAPIERYAVSAALSLLSEALGDPGVHVRAVLRHSPQPNELQKEHFARAFLQVGQPTEALAWLDGHWGRHEPSRLSLQAAALAALGRPGEAADRRRQLFESTLSVHDLQQWLALLPEAEQPGARALAREMARGRTDVAAVATLLLALDDAAAADEALVQGEARLNGRLYDQLVPLAKALRAQACVRGETVVLRALLNDILERASSPAYGHGARHLLRLREIAHDGPPLDPLPSHAAYEQHLRAVHPRKAAFWGRVAELQGRAP